LANGLCKLYKALEKEFKVCEKILLESRDDRSVRDFCKTAKLTKLFGIVQEKQ
jgi:hypothetical protein